MPDTASIAAARVLSRRIDRSCGGSTGTNMYAVAQIVSEMVARNKVGSVDDAFVRFGESATAALTWMMHG